MFRLDLAFRTILVLLVTTLFLSYVFFGDAEISAAQKQDAVKQAIRDKDVEVVRVNIRSEEERKRAIQLGTLISDYDSFVVIAVRPSSINLSGLDHQKLDTTVNLPGDKFDPLVRPPVGTASAKASSPKAGYYIVQFGGIVNDDWLDELRNAVEIIQYVPNQAFFVYGEGTAIAAAADHSRVRWVGEYLPSQKLSPDIVRSKSAERRTFDVAVFGRADLNAVASEMETSGGRVVETTQLPNNFFNLIRVELNQTELDRVAAISAVFRIDAYYPRTLEDERAAQIVAGNYISTTSLAAPGYNPLSQFGVTGLNVTVAVSDDGISIPGSGGLYITSANTVNGPLRGAGSGASGGHGHINATIIAGNTPFGALDPFGYNYGLGIAPAANIVNLPFLKSGSTSTEAQAVNDAVTTAGPNGVRATISNNSWGNGLSSAYDSNAAMYDGFTRDASSAASIDPLLLVFSAGNSGPGATTLTRPKAAKNLITVGNSENLRTEFGAANADNIDDLRNSSSRGPTADGRIKPDIVAPGSYITGGRAGNCLSVTSCFDANHAWSTGTSHAAPQVAGAAALFTQFWKDTNLGQNPSPALIKAAVINSAVEMNGFLTSTATVPNGIEGWGRIDMSNMLNTGVPMRYVDQSTPLTAPGQSSVLLGVVALSTKPVRVTLVWTDPPGASDPALVNNLDLTVTVGANTYRGNVFSGGVSVTGGSANSNDNVENVFLPAGIAPGTPITVTVSATALNGDGVLGNADVTDQHFGLVVYNESLSPTAAPASIGGRIIDEFGRGVRGTSVRLVGFDGSTTAAAVTNTFGFYRFGSVPAGTAYALTPSNKRYSFEPGTLLVHPNDDVTTADFLARPNP